MSSSDENPAPPPQKTESPGDVPAEMDFRARARQAMMRMARNHLKSGKLHTATASLLEIYQNHPETPEGQEAVKVLSQLAEEHEAAGRHRLAADLYKKLAAE